MTLRLSMLAAFGLLFFSGSTNASTYTLNLSASDVTHNVFASGQEGYGFLSGPILSAATANLAGPDLALLVHVGDELIVNISKTNGPFTLPASGHYSDFNYYLTGRGFPLGPNSLDGSVTVFNGATVVAANSFNSTQPDVGFSAVMFLNGPQPPITFDSITGDFFVRKIGGSSDPGATVTLNSIYFGAQISDRPAIPEPSTWAMMLLGFGGLGAALRRRRRQVAPAT